MSALEKNAADLYRQPLLRTSVQHAADDAEATRAACRLARLLIEEVSLRDRQCRLLVAELGASSQSSLWGINILYAYSGAEIGYRILAEVLKTIAAVDPSLVQLPQNHLAVFDHLRLDGSEEQKRFSYDLMLDGVCFDNVFSERHSRTVTEFRTRVPADGDGFRIDGRRFYSSGALLVRWVPAVGLDAEQRTYLAFIPRDAPGLTVIDDWSGPGQRTIVSGTAILDNVRVPTEHVIPVHHVLDRPIVAGAISQFIQAAIDVGIARGILAETVQQVRRHARPWVDANQQCAWEDPYTIQQVGDPCTRMRAVEVVPGLAANAIEAVLVAPDEESMAVASMVVAEAKVLTIEAALLVVSRLFELAGTRSTLEEFNLDRHWCNARIYTLYDPVRWKYHAIGNYQLNGVKLPRHAWF